MWERKCETGVRGRERERDKECVGLWNMNVWRWFWELEPANALLGCNGSAVVDTSSLRGSQNLGEEKNVSEKDFFAIKKLNKIKCKKKYFSLAASGRGRPIVCHRPMTWHLPDRKNSGFEKMKKKMLGSKIFLLTSWPRLTRFILFFVKVRRYKFKFSYTNNVHTLTLVNVFNGKSRPSCLSTK